jgi:hypothetical protein
MAKDQNDPLFDEVKDLGDAGGTLEADLSALGATAARPRKDDAKDLDAGGDLSLDDAIVQTAAAGLARADAGVGAGAESPLMGVDLDHVAASAEQQAAGRALTDREDALSATDAEVRARVKDAMVSDMATSTYDEAVMGGVYVGAVIGAIIGLAIFHFDLGHKLGAALGASVGLALVGGLVGYGLGTLVGAGASAAVRSERTGQKVLMSLGILLFAAPLSTVLIVALKWGFQNYALITAGALFVLALYLFVWTFQDASYRCMGSGSAISWGLLSAVFPPAIGVYIGRRPKGEITECSRCEKKHVATLMRCPHCGYVRRAGTKSQEDLDLDSV